MAIEYLGNKTRLLDFVVSPIAAVKGISAVADVFCGTASVSRALGERGLRVVASDHMMLCATLAEAALLPTGRRPFGRLGGSLEHRRGESLYAAAVRCLNELNPVEGFFFSTYSPASAPSGTTRMYLTESNAGKVDAMRSQIERWAPMLSKVERSILLGDLVRAVSSVSNTAGTYGCYLKSWKQRALEPLRLACAPLANLKSTGHEVHCADATAMAAQVEVDALYLDPPYTKRQYAAYYHLLETLVAGTEPRVTGSTGLPPWEDKQSEFCYRRRAELALDGLLAAARARHVFLSYSDDGHIPHERIVELMRSRGDVRWWEYRSRRYRSNSGGRHDRSLHERLYHLQLS
ncbi:MAG: DNA adenine methylase [Solirubrobacterales bacterium]